MANRDVRDVREVLARCSLLFIMLVLLLVPAACARPAADAVTSPTDSPPEPPATPEPTGPVLRFTEQGVLEGESAATPVPGTLRAGTAVATPTPVGSPGPTPVPTLNARSQRQVAELARRLDELQTAVQRRNAADLAKHQQELRQALERSAASLDGDQSPQAKEVANALNDIRQGLNGDLPKLDAAQQALRAFAGNARSGRAEARASPEPTLEPIGDLGQFASQVSRDLAAYQEAVRQRDAGQILALQSRLLTAAERAETALEGDQSAAAQRVRAAAGAVRAAVNGDQPKYQEATRQLAAVTGGDSARVDGAAGSAADVRTLAQDLENHLAGLKPATPVQSVQPGSDESDRARRQRELEAEIARVSQALEGDESPAARQLRQALSAVREAASGDRSKIGRARAQLQQVRQSS